MQQSNKTSQQLVESFFDVIKEKKLDQVLPEVSEKIYQVNKKKMEQQKAVVWSAIALPSIILQKINVIVQKQTGQKVKLNNKINSELLGGFKVEYGDWILDASLKHDFDVLQKNLYS